MSLVYKEWDEERECEQKNEKDILKEREQNKLVFTIQAIHSDRKGMFNLYSLLVYIDPGRRTRKLKSIYKS